MTPRWFIYFCMAIGSLVGAYAPMFWGGSIISFPSLMLSFVGALAGIWVAVKIGNSM